MNEKTRAIVETAILLAESGGFEAVRLRDVASMSGVALGTLYARFPSKEDILVASLELEFDRFERLALASVPPSASQTERWAHCFVFGSDIIFQRQNLMRAVLKAISVANYSSAMRVRPFQTRLIDLVVRVARPNGDCTSDERHAVYVATLTWVGLLNGWTADVLSQDEVYALMRHTIRVLFPADGFSNRPD